MSGYIAGVFCAVISHPADTIVSKLNAVKGTDSLGTNLSKIYKDIGFMGLLERTCDKNFHDRYSYRTLVVDV